MLYISHRGNINGRIEYYENHPDYVDDTIKMGYDVEIDLWISDGQLWLGHDIPQYETTLQWLIDRNDKLWVHCKNIEAVELVNSFGSGINYFWHQTDTVTLTSRGFIWAYPGKQPIKNSIAVLPEIFDDDISQCIGVCSDIIGNYKK